MNDRIAQKLKDLPDNPGVYIMRDSTGKVIYVGKAVVLKNRVRQYFQHTEKPVKVQAMVDNIADFEYIITRTEKDALALENNLIKKYKPYYNILLKDDKTSPYIRIDMRDEYPSIEVTRKVKRDGARYFGPFIGVSVRDVIAILRSVFRLRTCRGKLKKRARPCLDYDLDICLAPCCERCDRAEYMNAISSAASFLSGGSDDISGVLTQKMTAAAESENFERAISYRNQLKVLNNLKSKVVGELGSVVDIDTFYYTDNGIYGAVSVCIVRGGKMMGVKNYVINEPQVFGGDMTSFLPQYYSMTNELPDEICLQQEIDVEPISEYFRSVFSKRPLISFPQKGMRKKLLDTAKSNCTDFLLKSSDRQKRETDMTIGACERLKAVFNLTSARRIECYDISNISGVDKVASQVVFIDGKADKAQYRRYRIRTVEGADDFRSMYETLTRRFIRYINGDAGFNELPDLIVIDGGFEQVEFACRAAEEVGVSVPMVGLAKKDEEIYLRGNPVPIKLTRDDYGLKLMQRVRDEAHRFAIMYHRTLRSKRYESELKGVPGVGAATVKKVLEAFNTRTVVEASVDELAEKAGITKTAAKNIYTYFHSGEEMKEKTLKYKMVAVDLDGTMLNDELTVSKRNLDAISRYRDAGGIFTVSTGRSPEGVEPYRKLLGLDKYPVKMVCNLGCMIVDSSTMEADSVVSIENDTAAALIKYALPKSALVQMYSVGGLKVEKINFKTRQYCEAVGVSAEPVGDLVSYAAGSPKPIVKILLIVDERVVTELISSLNTEFPELHFIQSTAPLLLRLKEEGEDFQPTMIECLMRGADKGTGVKAVAELYGLDMSEVMVFGDSFNDVDMIKVAGMGVAMANAREPIRNLADLVAESNNDDGVAKVIEEYILARLNG